jgi:acyl carrier protein
MDARQREEVWRIIREVAPKKDQISTSSRLVEDLGFDSILLLELAVALEEHFDLPSLDEAGRRGVRTVHDVESLVAQVRAGRR